MQVGYSHVLEMYFEFALRIIIQLYGIYSDKTVTAVVKTFLFVFFVIQPYQNVHLYGKPDYAFSKLP